MTSKKAAASVVEPDLTALGNELLDAIAETPQPVIGRFRRHSDKLAADRAALVAEREKLTNERQYTRAAWERYDDAIAHHLADVERAIALYPDQEVALLESHESNVVRMGAAE